MTLEVYFRPKRCECMRLIGNKPLIYMEISDNSKISDNLITCASNFRSTEYFRNTTTDKIHNEDQNHGLACTKPKNGIYNTQHSRLLRKGLDLNPVESRTIKGGINLYIELQKSKLDGIAARDIRISLDKRIAFSK